MAGRDSQAGGDPVGDFQRWLMRSGARGLGRELTGRVRRAFGHGNDTGDVWETATTRPDPGEPPECAWCPVCRAARRIRESSPGFGAQLAGAGDAVAAAVHEAFAAFEAAMRAAARPEPAQPAGMRSEPTQPASARHASTQPTGAGRPSTEPAAAASEPTRPTGSAAEQQRY